MIPPRKRSRPRHPALTGRPGPSSYPSHARLPGGSEVALGRPGLSLFTDVDVSGGRQIRRPTSLARAWQPATSDVTPHGVQVAPASAALVPHLHSLIRLPGTGWAGLSRTDLGHHDRSRVYVIGDGQAMITAGSPHSAAASARSGCTTPATDARRSLLPASLCVAMEALRHSQISTTMHIYTHIYTHIHTDIPGHAARGHQPHGTDAQEAHRP